MRKPERLRAHLHRLLAAEERSDPAVRRVNAVLAAVIVVSVASSIAGTVPALAASHARLLDGIEWLSVAVFAIEYTLRAWAAVEEPRYCHPVTGRLRWALTPMALVDLAAFLPSLLALLVGGADLRWLRLVRLVRLLKLTRWAPALGLLGTVLRREAGPLLVAMSVLLVVLLFAAAGIWALEAERQPDAFGSIPAALWWAVATLTTVGYGDVVPVTPLGRLFAGMVTLVGMGMVSLPAGIIASGLIEALRERREQLCEMVTALAADGDLSPEAAEHIEQAGEALGFDREQTDALIRRTLARRG